MGVTCQILINKPKERVFRSGQVVTGTLRYAVDKTTEYKYIIVYLIGKGRCSWTEGSNKHRRTYTGTEEFTYQCMEVLNTTNEPSVTIPEGTYDVPFQFTLPDDIPTSYEDPKCRISYNIKIKFVKPSIFKASKRFYAEIPVAGFVGSGGPRTFGLNKLLLKPFSSRNHLITLKAVIDKTVVTPGESAKVVYVLTNDTNVTIKSVVTGLVCRTTYRANCGRTRRKERTIIESVSETPSVPADGIANLSAIVPTTSELYSVNSKILERVYLLTVCVKLPAPYINAKVDIPVLVGEQRLEAQCGDDEDDLGSDQPPSYWEVMNEDKDTEGDSAKE